MPFWNSTRINNDLVHICKHHLFFMMNYTIIRITLELYLIVYFIIMYSFLWRHFPARHDGRHGVIYICHAQWTPRSQSWAAVGKDALLWKEAAARLPIKAPRVTPPLQSTCDTQYSIRQPAPPYSFYIPRLVTHPPTGKKAVLFPPILFLPTAVLFQGIFFQSC